MKLGLLILMGMAFAQEPTTPTDQQIRNEFEDLQGDDYYNQRLPAFEALKKAVLSPQTHSEIRKQLDVCFALKADPKNADFLSWCGKVANELTSASTVEELVALATRSDRSTEDRLKAAALIAIKKLNRSQLTQVKDLILARQKTVAEETPEGSSLKDLQDSVAKWLAQEKGQQEIQIRLKNAKPAGSAEGNTQKGSEAPAGTKALVPNPTH